VAPPQPDTESDFDSADSRFDAWDEWFGAYAEAEVEEEMA
jgi:hypothetical protein